MKKMNWCEKPLLNKKGFTLIELLAIIVILAIIALIATPIILEIIDDTKVSADQRSKELYIEAVKNAIAYKNLKEDFRPTECTIKEDGNIDCEGTSLNIETDGRRPICGIIKVNNGKVSSDDLSFNKNNCSNNDNDNDEDKDLRSPDLVNGLIPVKYDGTNWVIADTTKEWYNYDNQEWANAIILKPVVEKSVGNTVDVGSEVQAMFVWIPRYEYKIEGQYGKHPDGTEGTQKLPGEIKVNFINKNVTTASEGYIVHPAFKFEEKELSGIWVGKFETSAEKTSTCYIKSNNINCNVTTITPYIIPNVNSLTNQTVSTQFTTAQKFKVTNMDSHMMKNSEWGAVAYLSQSKYGKYGNPNYAGVEKEVTKNPSLITGGGSYSTNEDQSTTGNITGVYDMSGGSAEYVMGNLNDTIGRSGFSSLPESKYYDKYTTATMATACNEDICYGQALSETAGWYGDNLGLINSNYSWLLRGCNSSASTNAGVFASGSNSGAYNSYNSFRVVLSLTA